MANTDLNVFKFLSKYRGSQDKQPVEAPMSSAGALDCPAQSSCQIIATLEDQGSSPANQTRNLLLGGLK